MQMSSSLVHTDIPFRLDRLPWSRFHLLILVNSATGRCCCGRLRQSAPGKLRDEAGGASPGFSALRWTGSFDGKVGSDPMHQDQSAAIGLACRTYIKTTSAPA